MIPTRRTSARRSSSVAIALALFAATAACGGGDDRADAASAPVVIELVAFKPDHLELEPGATVTWRNGDVGAHTVTSGTVEQGASAVSQHPDGAFGSDRLANGDTFSTTFDEPGTYPYFCSLHPATMRGEIRVA